MGTMSTRKLPVVRLAVSLIAIVLVALPLHAQSATGAERTRWEQRAERVTIARDEWGVPHVSGRTDADAVFGLIYAQAEDDFSRIETNYLRALGRLAEVEGEAALFEDLRTRLFVEPDSLRARYERSPGWLRALLVAWADGLNYYLHTTPEADPRAIRRFEPWMALAFSEGSITNDVQRVSPDDVEAFYGSRPAAPATSPGGGLPGDHDGSNAIAIAPERTAAGRALLLINPHTSFFFRTEVHISSDDGLNAYGAATWGQFFIFQGFNERLGWAHTTSGADAVDEYLETVTERGGHLTYRYGDDERPLTTSTITLQYRANDGTLAERSFVTYRTHRGPIIRAEGGRWVSVALMDRPVAALQQAFLRMKAQDRAAFSDALALQANATNNTVYADADGTIALTLPTFIPRRDDRFDFGRPVDGSDPATDWRGVHAPGDAPSVLDPASGWVQNTNNGPYSAAGASSPRPEDFPRYMDMFGENPRGIHAVGLLEGGAPFTMASLRDIAYDPYQPAFERVLPPFLEAYDAAPASHPLKGPLAGPIDTLRMWDYRWGTASVSMTLALDWTNEVWDRVYDRLSSSAQFNELEGIDAMVDAATPDEVLSSLQAVTDRLEASFGTWVVPWGEVNRLQRPGPDGAYSDEAPSVAVGFGEAWTGSLAVFHVDLDSGTRLRYGEHGNTFVAVVEFGDRVRAWAVRPGGQSSEPGSPHYDDQSARYATGDLREVHFHRPDVLRNTVKTYRPGRAQ